MKIHVGISNRHVHLTKDSLEILFGENFELEVKKELSQKGQFASSSVVTIKTEKDEINNVRVLGPTRDYNQVEISKTDAFKLGLNPPVKNSGDLKGSCPITIIGPKGLLHLNEGCIIATRHIHMSLDDLERYGFINNETVKVKINSEKPSILENVYIKATNDGVLELHLDTDDANACMISQGDIVEIEK